jgi:arabinofuranosyltransferase
MMIRRCARFAATAVVLTLGTWVFVRTAWVCDDAYISFRVIDNFVSGFGLRWNVDERVQTFTHPLWVFLLTPVYAVTREIYYTSLLVSGIVALVTLWIVQHRCSSSIGVGTVAAIALTLSPTFVTFSTSGLENTLTHLLVASYCAVYFSDRHPQSEKALPLSALASLCALNRLDTALMLGIPLAWLISRHPEGRVVRATLVGALPLIAWELFSLFYYGSLIPNTAYAKLNTGIPGSELISQGLTHIATSAEFDPLGAILIAFGTFVAPIVDRRLRPLSVGIAVQAAYVVFVGGDFMAGRFFSGALVAATATSAMATSQLALAARRVVTASLAVIVIAVGATTAQATILSSRSYTPGGFQIPAHGIIDERMYYYWATGLLSPHRTDPISHPFATDGMKWREAGQPTQVGGVMGFAGYFAGPKVHVIDVYALCDPLLARLPAIQPWRIGHFQRKLPQGYEESLSTGEKRIIDPNIARVYDAIVKATRDPLLSWERAKAIAFLNSRAAHEAVRKSAYAASTAVETRPAGRWRSTASTAAPH